MWCNVGVMLKQILHAMYFVVTQVVMLYWVKCVIYLNKSLPLIYDNKVVT